MKRTLIILAALSLATAAVPAFALPGIEAGARGMYWFPDLAATVKTTTGGITGEFNAKSDLGMKDKEFASGEAFVRFGNVTLRLGYTPVKFDADNRLARSIVFNGRTFSADNQVVSSLDLQMLDGEVQFDLLRPDLVAASFNLGLVLKVKYVDGKVELAAAGQAEKKDFKAPVPMVGVAAGVGILKDMVRVDARATGIGYNDNRLFEGDVYASFVPLPFFRIQGGYRFIDLKIDDNDVVARMKLKGPYVGAQLSF